jgi:ribosome-associated heat shock protein Hsp15
MTSNSLRIDRWLFFCRFFKTRSLATAAVTGGHVRLNGERVSPGTRVSSGDRMEVNKDRLDYVFKVVAVPSRRGPAKEAVACYEEEPESVQRRIEKIASLKGDRLQMATTPGKPDKHTRRKLITRNRG